MYLAQSFEGNQPITWWGRVPVYATTILTGVFIAGLVLVVLASAAHFSLSPIYFMPEYFVRGWLWQPLTYLWVDEMNFFTPLGILCFYMWGVEVEKYIGRARYLTLFALLLFFQPLLCLGYFALGRPIVAYGNYELVAGLLIAFATLYPNIEFFGWIPLKWFAFFCIATGSLMQVASSNYIALTFLLGSCALAFGYIRWLQLGGEMPSLGLGRLFRRRPRLRVLPDEAGPRGSARHPQVADPMLEVDAILDKINRTGFGSLSPEEKARLDRAGDKLRRREGG